LAGRTGERVPTAQARGGSTARDLVIVDEFANDAGDDAGTVPNKGEPSLYSRQDVAESQSCWLRSFGRRSL
jgi:hypothetical protein